MSKFYKSFGDTNGAEFSGTNLATAGTYNYIVQPNGELNLGIQFKPSDIDSVLKIYATMDDPYNGTPVYVDVGAVITGTSSWNADSLILISMGKLSAVKAIKLEVVVTGAGNYFTLKVKGC